jgi:hypothetical protein
MPTKPTKKPKQLTNPPAIYEKITDKEVRLSPSAWDVFQDYIKGRLAPGPSRPEAEDAQNVKEPMPEDGVGAYAPSDDLEEEISKPRKKSLNADIIWSGVAVGCLLGTVYFLFGGLQPLVLQNYIANAKQSIDDLGQAYIGQVNALSSAQTTIVQNTSYNILADCSEEQKYQTLEEGITKVELADRSLFPNQNYRTVNKFNGFGETEVREKYETFFDYYSNSLQNLRQTALEDIRDLPTYAQYRNLWIDGCILITKSGTNSSQVKEYCQDLQKQTEEYLQNQPPNFWEQVQTPVEDGLKLCQKSVDNQTGDFLDWKLSWLSSYGQLTSFTPNIQQNLDRINSAIQDMQAESKKYKKDLDAIYERKTNLTGIWYLLEF